VSGQKPDTWKPYLQLDGTAEWLESVILEDGDGFV